MIPATRLIFIWNHELSIVRIKFFRDSITSSVVQKIVVFQEHCQDTWDLKILFVMDDRDVGKRFPNWKDFIILGER